MRHGTLYNAFVLFCITLRYVTCCNAVMCSALNQGMIAVTLKTTRWVLLHWGMIPATWLLGVLYYAKAWYRLQACLVFCITLYHGTQYETVRCFVLHRGMVTTSRLLALYNSKAWYRLQACLMFCILHSIMEPTTRLLGAQHCGNCNVSTWIKFLCVEC